MGTRECSLQRVSGGARVPLPAGLLGGCQHRPLFTSGALRRQRKAGPECQRFDEGPGASSNPLPWFWEPKNVLSVLMGTPGLLHTSGQQIPTTPAPPSRVLLATTPGQPHPAPSVPSPSPEEQGPLSQLPATPPHPRTSGGLARPGLWAWLDHRMARRAPFQRLSLLARYTRTCEGARQEPGARAF